MTTCTWDDWNVATLSGSRITGCVLECFRGFFMGKPRKSWTWGMHFDTDEAASRFALEHGYTQTHYRRPNVFINLALSPASRRWVQSKPEGLRFQAIAKLLDSDEVNGDYWKHLLGENYMAKQRREFLDYINNPGRAYRAQREPQIHDNL